MTPGDTSEDPSSATLSERANLKPLIRQCPYLFARCTPCYPSLAHGLSRVEEEWELNSVVTMFSSPKPYTAVTVHVERLTAPDTEVDDYSGIVDLIEVVRIQDSGPTEAARAIRKKLKYGNSHRQLRALTIIDGLIQNAGSRFQRTFADEMLLERLRILPRDEMVDAEVRAKCEQLFRQWSLAYKDTPGLGGIAQLHKQLPKKAHKPKPSQSRVVRETEREAAENPFDAEEDNEPAPPPQAKRASLSAASPGSPSHPRKASLSAMPTFSSHSSKKDKKTKRRPFSIERDKGEMMQAIAGASVASTNLFNGLKLIDRETTRPSEDQECLARFQTCKQLRRQVLRYIQLVESDQWIGSLLQANDVLVNALITFEMMDKGIEEDSDSEPETAHAAVPPPPISPSAPAPPRKSSKALESFSRLKIAESPPPRPPRPASNSISAGSGMGYQRTPLAAAMASSPGVPHGAPPVPKNAAPQSRVKDDDDEGEFDEDDPFGDSNAVRA